MARRTRDRRPLVYNGADPAQRAAALLVLQPFEPADEMRDGLLPMTGDVDLFTGEVVDLVLRRAGVRGVQASLF